MIGLASPVITWIDRDPRLDAVCAFLGTATLSHRKRKVATRCAANRSEDRHHCPTTQSTEKTMQITKSSIETMTGPSDWFTGAVYIDTVATPSEPSRLSASSVHFTPGARTAWHTHPNGQSIYVTEGTGRVQRRGGTTEVIRPGDRVFFEPGEDHWHGAAPTRFMTHLAMIEVDHNGNSAAWGAHVTDEEYGAPTPLAVQEA